MVGILTFLGFLIAPGSFLIHPTYEVGFESKESGHIKVFTVTNTGWIQAKNVEIHLNPGIVDGIQTIDCPEGESPPGFDLQNIPKLKLKRMRSDQQIVSNLILKKVLIHYY